MRERERIFETVVDDERPDVVVVDRHPYGTAGELRSGLDLARRRGAALVLGLRDVLDEPSIVREEMRGLGWAHVEDVYDDVLVYGARHFVDFEAEYGLSLPLHYCGWVVERPGPSRLRRNLLVVAAGGGGDGAAVFEMGARVLTYRTDMVGLFTPGPYAGVDAMRRLSSLANDRVHVVSPLGVSGRWFSRADGGLVHGRLQLNPRGTRCRATSDLDASAQPPSRASHPGGVARRPAARRRRPSRRGSRRCRVTPARPRRLPDGALESAGIHLDGALNAARRLHAFSAAGSVR